MSNLLTFPYNKSRIDLMAQNRVGIINVTDNKLNTTPVKSPKDTEVSIQKHNA